VNFYSITINGWSSQKSKHYLNFFVYYCHQKEIKKVALWIEFVDALTIDGNEIVEIIKKVVKQF
jgi:hypothetical protein